ncbi:MAG: DUF1887 family CARF protein [Cyanobacteriota bacterium]
MGKLIISLISDQTIPNIIFLKDHNDYDKLLFISTAKMKKSNKVEAIANTLDIVESKYNVIEVDENSLSDIPDKLNNYFAQNKFDSITLNMTGGTKIMSLAAYNYIKINHPEAKIVYIPIPKNEFIDLQENKTIQITQRLNVKEYLSSYFLKIKTKQDKLDEIQNKAIDRQDLTLNIFNNYNTFKVSLINICDGLRDHRTDKKYDITDQSLLNSVQNVYSIQNNTLFMDEIKYLTGGWLEEYVFILLTKLKEEITEPLDVILSCNISRFDQDQPENDIDLIFTFRNAIYHIECKSLDFNSAELINSTIYKSSALQKDFGLRVKTILVSTDEKIYAQKYQDRSRLLNVNLLGPNELNKDTFKNKIKELLNIKECVNVQTS